MICREHFNTIDGKCYCCGDSISIENWHEGRVIPAAKEEYITV